MKHAALRSIAHNLGDSLGSGIGLLVGHFEMDIYGEAAASPGGVIAVDFLTGRVVEGQASPSLQKAIEAYQRALPDLCARHGASLSDFDQLIIRFWTTPLGDHLGRRLLLQIRDSGGRESETEYGGTPAQRIKTLDAQGRLRPKVG